MPEPIKLPVTIKAAGDIASVHSADNQWQTTLFADEAEQLAAALNRSPLLDEAAEVLELFIFHDPAIASPGMFASLQEQARSVLAKLETEAKQ